MSSLNPTAPNRADLLRQRRNERGRENQPRSGSMARKPAKAQPVMARNFSVNAAARPLSGLSPLKSKQARPRRQMYYSLGATGAEVRLPAMPVIKPGWRLLSGLLVVLFSLGIFAMLTSTMFVVEKVDIAGLQRLNPADLEAALAIQNLSIIEIDPALLTEQIAAAYPELTDIQVNVTFPAAVGISAHERQPKINWKVGDHSFWIDSEGVVIPARGEPAEELIGIQADSRPPLVALPAPTEEEVAAKDDTKPQKDTPASEEEIWGRVVDSTILQAAEQLRPYIPAESNLVYNIGSGLGWKDPRGWKVFVGNTLDNIELKLAEYQAVVDTLNQRGIIPTMISVEHLHAPFYRTE